MKKRILSLLLSAALLLTLSGCGEDTLLNKREPVTVTFWHVYGEQSGSPMDVLVQEFNRTRRSTMSSMSGWKPCKRQMIMIPSP